MISYGTLPFILFLSALSAAIIAAHALAVFAGGRLRRIATPIGIALHLLTLLLFLCTVDSEGEAMALEVVVLFFILSTLVYTALFFVREQLDKRAATEKSGPAEIKPEKSTASESEPAETTPSESEVADV